MGCCGVNYEEEIEKDISNYIQTLNISDDSKRKLLSEIKDDLKKRSSTDKNYNPSRIEEVEKTVNYYKNYISLKLKNNNELQKVNEKENKIESKKIERNDTNDNYDISINKEENIKKIDEKIKFISDYNDIANIEIKNENDKKKENEVKENKSEVKKEEHENINEENRKEEKEIVIVKEEKQEEKDEINWKEMLKDDNNFSQKVPFDFKDIFSKLQKASKSPSNLNPYYTLSAIFDFTKIFKEISSALSMGFSDITEKCGIMRKKFDIYPDATSIQNLLQSEINLNLHKLNGDNNKKLGHGSDEYKDYTSACRTFLRLLWFFEYLIDIFENVLKDDGSGAIKTILGDSYDKVLAPHHTFMVRKAVGFALMFSSAGNVAKNAKLIFGIEEYNDETKKIIKDTVDLMKIIWKGGNDFYEKYELLNLE